MAISVNRGILERLSPKRVPCFYKEVRKRALDGVVPKRLGGGGGGGRGGGINILTATTGDIFGASPDCMNCVWRILAYIR